MAEVRVNGKRLPPLQSIDNLETLVLKLETLAQKNKSALTTLSVNSTPIDIDNSNYLKMKLEREDRIEARFDTSEQLSFESLQVAIDMAELLITDLKIVTLKLWDSEKNMEKTYETLLNDCTLFLSLAARPVYLLGYDPEKITIEAQNCLQELDRIANYLENATLLAVHEKHKEACTVLVGMVKPSIERWIGLSAMFAQILNINCPQISITPEAPEAGQP